jgi:hypothetical protein
MYYTNIGNPDLQYFKNLTVPNFTIKLTDLLSSDLFKVDEIITDTIYKIYPLFYCNEITSSNTGDKVLENRLVICMKHDQETYLTFLSDDGDVQDYQNFTSYYGLSDSLTTAQFNGIVSLLRSTTIHKDSFNILEDVTGKYGNYLFSVDGCTVLDTGIVVDSDTVSAEPKVKLTDNVFHYSTYTLKLDVIHYTGVNIFDDDTENYIVVDTLEIELVPDEWVTIPLTGLSDGYVIGLDAVVEIVHDKPIITDAINSISVNGVPDILQTGETAELYATGYDIGGVPVGVSGHTIHFFERIQPVINVSASEQIIQTNEDAEFYAKVKDTDGSLAKGVKVHFYTKEE